MYVAPYDQVKIFIFSKYYMTLFNVRFRTSVQASVRGRIL